MKHSGLDLCHIVNFFARTKLVTRSEGVLCIQICMLSMQEGHCFASNAYLGKRIGVSSVKEISRMLSSLKDKELINLSGTGRDRIITPSLNNFISDEKELAKEDSVSNNLSSHVSLNSEELSTHSNNLSSHVSLTPSSHVSLTHHPMFPSPSPIPLNKEKIKEKIKEEVVLSAAPRQPNTTPFFTASFFERDPSKEEIDPEARKRLVETYGRESVAKFEANALSAMIKSAEGGHANGKFYKRGLEEITRDFCEQEHKRKAARNVLAEKKINEKPISLDELVQIRRKKLLKDEFLSQFVTVDSGGFFVKESKLSTGDFDSLAYTGMSFDDKGLGGVNSYDEKLARLDRELRKIAKAEIRGVHQMGIASEPRRPQFFNTSSWKPSKCVG